MKLTNGPQQQVDEYDESGGKRGIGQIARTRQHVDCRRTPQRGRRIEPAHAHALAEDQSGAEEPDARDHLCRDTGRTRLARNQRGKHDEARRAQGDQRVRAQSGKAVTPLPLKADGGAEAKGGREIERCLFDGHRHRQ
jgi:hypothetical protein